MSLTTPPPSFLLARRQEPLSTSTGVESHSNAKHTMTSRTQVAIMESRWGLCPDMGSSPLLLGLTQYDKALLLSSQGEPIDAKEAFKLGLITEIVEDPEKRCNEIIEQLRTRSPDALAAIKRVSQASFHFNRRRILAKETWSQIKLLLSKNTRIAMHNATKDAPKPYRLRGKW